LYGFGIFIADEQARNQALLCGCMKRNQETENDEGRQVLKHFFRMMKRKYIFAP